MDKEVLYKIKRKIEKLGDKTIGETQTKESFINPLIIALGWDVSDFDEVKLEYKYTKKATPVDYALLIDLTPKLYIEAKQFGSNLDDYKWIAQILTYSTMAGVKWSLLTDGNHYKLYNTTAEARLEEKLFYEWKITEITEENADKILNFLKLLTKDKFKDDEIERAWKNHFEVNKVRKSLKKLIDDKDESLLKLINKKTKLGRTVIVNSLNKLKVKIGKIYALDVSIHEIPQPIRVVYTGKEPEKAKLFNETFEVKTWSELLIVVAEKLLKYNPEAFNKLSDSEIMKGEKRTYLSKNKNLVINPHQLSNGLFLETYFSANQVVRIIKKRMLKGCGYEETDIEIFVKD